MFETDKFTRTEETESDYRYRCENLLENYAKTGNPDWDISPESLIQWLTLKRNDSSPAYWGRIRSALVWFFKNIGHPGLSDSIQRISKEGCAPPRFTSAKKKKSVSDDELVELANYLLGAGSSDVSRETYKFFVSGVLTGMRPCEWARCEFKIVRDSQFFDLKTLESQDILTPDKVDGIQIIVQNAKATNGRANGPTRPLLFSNLHPQEIDVLLEHWRSVERELQLGTFPEFQRRCSDKIRYAGNKIWPSKRKRISLYSGRHQSMANGKASGLPKKVIAAMHGHATDRTAGEHYGKKQYGKSGRVYFEVPEELVSQVKEVPSNWNPEKRTLIEKPSREK